MHGTFPLKPERPWRAGAARPTQVVNALQVSRDQLSRIVRKTYGGDRNVPEVLGYKTEPEFTDFQARYLRQDIAGRVVDLPVKATWSDEIEVTGADGKEAPFDFGDLKRRLKLTRRLVRVDGLAQLGRYAVLLIGVKGENPVLAEPIEVDSLSGPDDVIFLSAYCEPDAKIKSYVRNAGDERFGLPETYTLSITANPGTSGKELTKDVPVHHSRILHVSDSGIRDDIFGVPRLLGILDRLEDLEKVVGGSAEMFWQGAARAIIASIQKDANLSTDELTALTAAIKKWSHGLSRAVVAKGVDVKSLPATVPDPRGIFEVLISLIGARSEIPQRILLGSERGELASTQDRENFASTIRSRRANYAEPIVLRPLLERLQQFGALEKGEFEIVWPDPLNLSVMDVAEIRQKNAAAFKSLEVPGVPDELANVEERRQLLGLTPERPGGRLTLELNEADPEVATSPMATLRESDSATRWRPKSMTWGQAPAAAEFIYFTAPCVQTRIRSMSRDGPGMALSISRRLHRPSFVTGTIRAPDATPSSLMEGFSFCRIAGIRSPARR